VRRVALGPDGEPVPPRAPGTDPASAFSEMAMYVLPLLPHGAELAASTR
jgi:hypothetical protein